MPVAQAVQDVVPHIKSFQYVLTAHEKQEDEEACRYFPTGQTEQVDFPPYNAKLPSAHAVQWLAPAAENVPAGQNLHCIAVMSRNWPASQTLHDPLTASKRVLAGSSKVQLVHPTSLKPSGFATTAHAGTW